jgi:hypothetical protein
VEVILLTVNMHVAMSVYLLSGQKAAKTRLVQIKAWLGFGVFSETNYYSIY